MARTAAPTPDFLSSPVEAELISIVLSEIADQREQENRENGSSRVGEVLVRTYRRASHQLGQIAASAEDAA
jgi:hypothetical protein